MSTEKATRQHEQPIEAGHEVRKGHLGIQAFHEVCTKGKVQIDPYRLQLSAFEKVRS